VNTSSRRQPASRGLSTFPSASSTRNHSAFVGAPVLTICACSCSTASKAAAAVGCSSTGCAQSPCPGPTAVPRGSASRWILASGSGTGRTLAVTSRDSIARSRSACSQGTNCAALIVASGIRCSRPPATAPLHAGDGVVAVSREAILRRCHRRHGTLPDTTSPASSADEPDMTVDDRRLPVRLYWSDGRVEDLKQPLDVTERPHIARNTDAAPALRLHRRHRRGRGLRCCEEQPGSPDDR